MSGQIDARQGESYNSPAMLNDMAIQMLQPIEGSACLGSPVLGQRVSRGLGMRRQNHEMGTASWDSYFVRHIVRDSHRSASEWRPRGAGLQLAPLVAQ